MKKVLASVLAVLMLLMCIPLGAVSVSAASASQYAPYAKIEYGYTANVSCGTVRYMSQIAGSSYFYDAYWGSWKSQAGIECGTCSISMSLSYIGVSKTPKEILDYGKGETYFGTNWGGAQAKNYTYSNLSTAVDNYVNGNGKYSPPVIHLNKYSGAGHFVVLVGRISSNQYQVLDPANSSLWSITISGSSAQYKHPSTGATISDSIDWLKYDGTQRYDDIYQWYNPDAAPTHIAESFKSHCVVKVTNASTIKSLPCSKDTDPNSADVESVKVGDEYEAIALYRNDTKTGNLWYKVKTKSGGTGYLFAGNTKFVKQLTDDVTVKNPVSPASIDKGKSFIIGGTISSSYQTITRVQAWVTSPGGLTDYLYGHHDNLSVASYNLSGSPVDNMLKFGSLEVGIYQYRVRVRVDSYYATDATTTATVYNDELYLDDCGSIFFVLDPSCQHSYTSTVKNPTCTEGGYTTYTCTLCGYAYDDNHTNALGCDYETAVTKPSCTGQGYTTAVCRRCGKTETGNYVDPTGHWYTLEEIAATCTEPIKLRYTCITCGYFYEEIIASYTSEWSTEYPDVDDSAIIESKTEYRYRYWIDSSASWTEWSDWGDSYDPSAWVEERVVYRYLLVEYAFHDFEFTIIVPGTCTTSTLTVKTCVNCGMSYEVEFPATGHIYEGTMTIPYTCGTDGLGTYVCTRDGCGDSYTVVFPATGNHTYDDDYDADCNGCGALREVPEKPKAYNGLLYTITDGEVTITGYTDDIVSDVVIPETIEGYPVTTIGITAFYPWCGVTSVTIPASITLIYGGAFVNCYELTDVYYGGSPADREKIENGGDNYYFDHATWHYAKEDLPADAPAFVVDTVTACAGEEITVAIRTLRNSGIVSMRLEVAYDADVLELISLEEGDFANAIYSPTSKNPFIINWVDAINPNNTTDGVIVLATFRVKEGAPIGQTAITINYDPEDVYDQNYDNVAFRVENGYVEVVDYVLGDVNDDGRINNKDLGLLQQYLAGFDVTVNTKAADVNADNRVNNKDLGLLQQYLAGFEVELG